MQYPCREGRFIYIKRRTDPGQAGKRYVPNPNVSTKAKLFISI